MLKKNFLSCSGNMLVHTQLLCLLHGHCRNLLHTYCDYKKLLYKLKYSIVHSTYRLEYLATWCNFCELEFCEYSSITEEGVSRINNWLRDFTC